MTTFEPALWPEEAKRDLCESIMDELGIRVSRVTSSGEMIHSCPLPFGQHANGDLKPSASLNYKKLTFRCLGCGAKGGLLFFLGAVAGDVEPREWLESRTGMGRTAMDIDALLAVIDAIFAPGAVERAPMPTYGPSVLDRWTGWAYQHPLLTLPSDEGGRGIPEATLDHFSVGYAPEYGLKDPTERIIIPHFWEGALVGWQARRIYPHDEPKYKNSPEFPRDRTFYNVPDSDSVTVVESPMSVLRHHHHAHLAASFGAALSESQLRYLYRYREVILWFDNDKAGWESTTQVGEHLSRYSSVSVVESPYSADPADMDDETVERLIASAVPYYIWNPPKELQPWP